MSEMALIALVVGVATVIPILLVVTTMSRRT